MSKKNNFQVPVNQLTKSYRTKFDMSHTVKGSFNHGKLVPFDVIECLPGDTFKIDLASIIRMSTPIAPIMDNIHMHVAAYFVPNRITYENWEELMGVNKTGAWLTSYSTYVVPTVSALAPALSRHSIFDYMGIPYLNDSVSGLTCDVNALPLRSYALIWNEYYRSPVVSAPLPVDRSSANKALVSSVSMSLADGAWSATTDLGTSQCLPLPKFADYFTKCLPAPIKHDPIAIVPGNLEIGAPALGVGADVFVGKWTGNLQDGMIQVTKGTSNLFENTGSKNDGKIQALTNGTWNTIEALRTAFQLDRFYYKDSYARNYRDMLLAHFNVDNRDAVMQIPQKVGELRWRINIDQVLSTAGYSASASTTVGAPGANSVTAQKGALTTFSATEHGYLIIVGGTRHDHTYGQGIHKMWSRSDRLDFYDPVFARIGDQPVDTKELYTAYNAALPTTVFGYQEAWAEYRFMPDRVCGFLSPYYSGSLDFWTLTDNLTGSPLLNETFVYENRNSLARALVTSSTGPDYIFDFYFKVTAVREMPLFSVPGLADHF